MIASEDIDKETGLPVGLLDRWVEEIKREKPWQKLNRQYCEILLHGNIVRASQLKADMRTYVRQRVNEKIRQLGQVTREAADIQRAMTPDDAYAFSVASDKILLAADTLETSIMDLQQLLHKYAPDSDIIQFNRLDEVLRLAREQLRFMAAHVDMDYQTRFADTADDLQELIDNKVRSMVRRRWEANAKKPQ